MAQITAYGFATLEGVMTERVVTVGQKVVWDAVKNSAAEHDRIMRAMLSNWAAATTEYSERYYLPGTGTLQPLDEFGNPRPVRPTGYYDVAYPLHGAGTAWGNNRVTRAKMTVDEANRFTLDAQARDADWIRRHMLAAIYTNVTHVYDDQQWGNLTIQPIANGDSVTYERFGGAQSTDTHFLAQAAAIADGANPFPTIYDELREHPSNMVSSQNPVVVYVPTNLRATIQALATFYPLLSSNVRAGANESLAAEAVQKFMLFGDRVLGVVGDEGVVVVEWASLPNDYMIAHATGAGPFLAMREHPEPELRGVIMENFTPDGNANKTSWIRYAGFGARNRVAALAYRIGNAAYAIPTGYTAPLAS